MKEIDIDNIRIASKKNEDHKVWVDAVFDKLSEAHILEMRSYNQGAIVLVLGTTLLVGSRKDIPDKQEQEWFDKLSKLLTIKVGEQ